MCKLRTDNHGDIELITHYRIIAAVQWVGDVTLSSTPSPACMSPELSQSGFMMEATVPENSDDVETSADTSNDVETPIASKIIKCWQVLSSDKEAVMISGLQSPKSPCRRQKKKKKRKEPSSGVFFINQGDTPDFLMLLLTMWECTKMSMFRTLSQMKEIQKNFQYCSTGYLAWQDWHVYCVQKQCLQQVFHQASL